MPPVDEALSAAAGMHDVVVLDAAGSTFADCSLLNLLLHTRHATDFRTAASSQPVRACSGADQTLQVRDTVQEDWPERLVQMPMVSCAVLGTRRHIAASTGQAY